MTRRFLRYGFWLAVVGWTSGNLSAADVSPDVKAFVQLFELRYRAARTLQATFLERYTENGRVVRVEAGVAYFRRPGKMRWEYGAPENNLFLIDGKTAWFYVPADHTATRVPAKLSTDWRTPLALLAGEMKVSRVCARVQAATTEKAEDQDHVVLYCEVRTAEPGGSSRAAGTGAPQGAGQDAVFFEVARDTGEWSRLFVGQRGGVQ